MASASDGVVPRQNRLFVAAIDFGTTYSGYAFSSKDDWEKDPLKIITNSWNAGTKNLLCIKAPTTLLLNPDKSFRSFGYEAETEYAEMVEDEKDFEDYYYFHCFKMLLHSNKRLRRDTEIKDATGKPLKAMHVFSQSIKFLRDVLSKSLNRILYIQDDDIHYILTVPAIWDDIAKQFMREAAVKAGISEKQLSIALEPETASIYCQALARQTDKGGASFLGVAETGKRFMVVDLGEGRTTDITFHERCRGGKLKEIHRPMGGPWGGRNIHEAFFAFIEELFGKDVFDEFKKNHMDDYLEMEREFELKKRAFTSESGAVKIKFPLSLIEMAKKIWKTDSVDDVISTDPKYAGKITAKYHKIQIPADIFISLFLPIIGEIITHIKKIMEENSVSIDYILMVGGFAECDIVQKEFRSAFSDKKVIIPEEPGLAVLKGAVMYGHMPQIITTRVARHTYGIQSWPEFDARKHPISKRVTINGVARCKDVFFKYVTIGQEITPGYQRSQVFRALKPEENTLECTIFASWEKDPKFITDESCFKLGTLTVPLPKQRSSEPLEIEEKMVFGETELHISARDTINNRIYNDAFFNFLDK